MSAQCVLLGQLTDGIRVRTHNSRTVVCLYRNVKYSARNVIDFVGASLNHTTCIRGRAAATRDVTCINRSRVGVGTHACSVINMVARKIG